MIGQEVQIQVGGGGGRGVPKFLNFIEKGIDHNALASIVLFNLPFSPTMRTLYQIIP